MSPPRLHTFVAGLVLALGYFVTGRLGLMLPAVGTHITLIWLPTGIAVAALLRWGWRCWPGIALGAFAVNVSTGVPWSVGLVIAGGNTLGLLCTVLLLERTGFHGAFDRKRDILLLAAAAITGTFLSASIGTAALSLAAPLPEGRMAAWLIWWAGDATGIVTAAPLLLTARHMEWSKCTRRRQAEFFLWLILTVLVTWAVFEMNDSAEIHPWALAFLPLPMVAWAALRFGTAGTSLGIIILSAGAAYSTPHGHGAFHHAHPLEPVLELWLFMVTTAVLGWLISALHRAQVQATRLQQLFEQALSDVSLGVLLADGERKVTYANQGFTRLTGYPETDVLGKTCALLQGPDTDPQSVEQLRAALHGDGYFEGEILNYRKDGRPFWNSLLISPVRDERGARTGFLGIQRDVSERRQVATALHESEEHLRTIVELEPECVMLLSRGGHLLEVNPAGLVMFEAEDLETVRGRAFADLLVPDERPAFADMHRRVLEGTTDRRELAMTGLHGTRRWVEMHAVPYRNAQREIVAVLSITRDISRRREAAEEQERSLSTLQLFINSVPAYISFVDAGERYRMVNKRYEDYFGLPAERILGQRVRDLQSPAVYAEMKPRIQAALAGQEVSYESQVTGPDGRKYWLQVQYVPRRCADGTVSGIFVLVFDTTERVQREAALREGEDRFRRLIELAPEAIVLLDVEQGRFVQANPAAEHLFQLSAAQLSQLGPIDVSPPIQPDGRASREKVAELVAEVLAGGAPVFEWTHRNALGRDIPCEVRLLSFELDGRVVVRGSLTDITERKRLELEREQYLKFFLLSTEPMCIADPFGCFQHVNPAFMKLTGYSETELISKPYIGFVLEADRRRTLDEMKLQVSLRPSLQFENRYVCKDGRIVLLSWTAIFDRNNGVTYATARDVTELREAERALQEAVDRLRKTASQVPGLIYQYRLRPDGTSCFPFASDAIREIYRVTPDEVRDDASKVFAVLHPGDRASVIASIQQSARDLTPWRHEYRVEFPDGSVRWLFGNSLPQREPDGSTIWHGFITDITERRQAQIERAQLDRKVQETQKLESLGVLAGGIAHDFNNLLTSVLGHASIAALEAPPGSSTHQCLEQINEAAQRAADLCKQMLAYSGRGRFVVQKIDLGTLVEQTAQMLQISISKKAVLRSYLEKRLPAIEADATQIRQVLMNLVINASEAIGDTSGVICLSTGLTRVDREYLRGTLMDPDLPEGDYVFLEVSDSGCGMSAETQARIFDPFFTTKFTGRGLGLAAVLGIVRGHKGALKVYSELERGTTFKLLFPAMPGPTEPSRTPPTPAAEWKTQGTVLVADDEETLRSTTSRMLQLMGLEPVLTCDGREAIEVFRANPDRFSFVLLDLTMPHLDGEQTFTELRRIRPGVRVILMSGFNAQEVLVRFSGKGLASFVQKPFTLDALRSAVRGVIG